MPFKPGQSGNPSGARVKSIEQRDFEAKCREWCQVYAFDKLKYRLNLDDDKRSDWALEVILNRAFGKPVETSILEASVTQQTGTPLEDLEGELDALVPEAAVEGAGHDSPPTLDGGK